ncbi:dTDP-4-dehydrorhamnose 3,5-epimerase family protein [Asticcacaulis sp. AC402]|uniref:dTDP-4-dehydrorhamnose 3,5-epimerase family protein n=1 Tax=Asticcacaulis sp. AC402 TaxID=1282361 RepID=UPI0003C3DA9C|nr:dTDP-4-dehydrorhamnose 3,5-epimerase family protein [Asticcacaulis sp. AC402]ESQ75342.1 hypothetical protein ABAC402_09560 [Asticcacaulis sp. AC402]
MRFEATPIPGAMIVAQQPISDERGSFARTYCRDTFAVAGLDFVPVQESLSKNRARFTLRGMHLQTAPHAEQKLVRCTRGAVFDVAVDLRPDSPSRGRWFGLELSADNGLSLFIPRGVAHGFLTLRDDAEVFYLIDVPYAAGSATGVRWNSPVFAIAWPSAPAVISDRDSQWPDDA